MQTVHIPACSLLRVADGGARPLCSRHGKFNHQAVQRLKTFSPLLGVSGAIVARGMLDEADTGRIVDATAPICAPA